MKISFRVFVVWLGLLLSAGSAIIAPQTTGAIKYGAGSYGRCQYQTCTISLSSSSSVLVNVLPSGTTRCSVSKDTATVTTSSSTGYTLKLSDADTANTLISGSNTIPATTGTYASPQALVAKRWGYRVDGLGTFGAGPTSTLSNGSIPSQTYAAVPISSGTPDTIASSSVAAGSGVATSIWYGLCVDASVPSGTYSDAIIYTAVIN